MEEHNYFLDALIFLAASVIAVPISKRIGLGSVLGYLLAGVILGPYVLGLIKDDGTILHFSEFGVVLLLFLIGLELNPSRLWQLRRPILGMGGLQVLITGAAVVLLSYGFGLPLNQSIVIGMGFALSSTAIALQTLKEKNLLSTPAGNSAFSVLLFQDIAVIPMIAILPLLVSGGGEQSGSLDWSAVLIAFAAIAFIIFGGRFLIRPIFRYIAETGMREIFTAFSLFLVIGIAQLMAAVGLSMALGTFLAGVLLAESEYRHELEIDIEPFKGLLMGLFFIAVGMSMNFGLLWEQPLLVLGAVAALVLGKMAVLYGLGKLFKFNFRENLLFTFVLAQGGEFGFVLFSMAKSQQILPADIEQLLVLIIALSMILTPILMIMYERITSGMTDNDSMEVDVENNHPEVIIAGHGRFGQVVGRMLATINIPTTVLDHDPSQIELLRKFGFKVFYGDASRPDLLHSAGLESAKILVLAMDDAEAITETAKFVSHEYPNIKIVARARNRQHAMELIELGVTDVTRETFESSLALSEQVLEKLGFNRFEAHQMARKFNRYDMKLLEEQAKMRAEESELISLAARARQDLEELFVEDRASRKQTSGDGWG